MRLSNLYDCTDSLFLCLTLLRGKEECLDAGELFIQLLSNNDLVLVSN